MRVVSSAKNPSVAFFLTVLSFSVYIPFNSSNIHPVSFLTLGENARAFGWMQPHLNAHTYIGEMFDFMGHFAELYVGRVGIARRKNVDDVDSQCTSFLRRFRFTNAAFGEIKKQLVSCYYPLLPFPPFPAPSLVGSPRVRRWNLVETRMTSFEVPG